MMLRSAFDCVESLYHECLYESVIELATLLLTICERCPDFLSNQQRYQMLVYYADSLFHANQYKKAEQIYMKALHIKRQFLAADGKPGESKGYATRRQTTNEAQIKYQLYRCLIEQRKYPEAIGVLESIPMKSRSAVVNSGLASLYQQLGNRKAAAESYRAVLQQCPCALDAIAQLLSFGMSMSDIKDSFMKDPSFERLPYMDWFPKWIIAQESLAAKDYVRAVRLFKELDASTNVSNNVRVLCALGKAYYYAGERSQALSILQRVHSLDPLCLDGMDMLASILFEGPECVKELESLAARLTTQYDLLSANSLKGPPGPQPWIVMGYLCMATSKMTRALYFAHKACTMGPRQSEEALLLKGLVLLECDKFAEATLHFREALAIAPHRFEIHQGIVDAYLARGQTQQAGAAARYCAEQLGHSARSLALYASVLAKKSNSLDKAQKLLERVVAITPYLLTAVYELVDIYDKRGMYDKAITLLRQQVGVHVKCKLHKLLGDFLMKVNKGTEALDRYRYALTLDPNNSEIRRGMNELEDELRVGPMSSEEEDTEFLRTISSEDFAAVRPVEASETVTITAPAARPSSCEASSSTAMDVTSDSDERHGTRTPPTAGTPMNASEVRRLTSAPIRLRRAGASISGIGGSSGSNDIVHRWFEEHYPVGTTTTQVVDGDEPSSDAVSAAVASRTRVAVISDTVSTTPATVAGSSVSVTVNAVVESGSQTGAVVEEFEPLDTSSDIGDEIGASSSSIGEPMDHEALAVADSFHHRLSGL